MPVCPRSLRNETLMRKPPDTSTRLQRSVRSLVGANAPPRPSRRLLSALTSVAYLARRSQNDTHGAQPHVRGEGRTAVLFSTLVASLLGVPSTRALGGFPCWMFLPKVSGSSLWMIVQRPLSSSPLRAS